MLITQYCRLWLIPLQKDDPNKWAFFAGGNELDLPSIESSREELQRTINSFTGIDNLKYGEVINLGRWKPNVRTVDPFRKGRVLIAGGLSLHLHLSVILNLYLVPSFFRCRALP